MTAAGEFALLFELASDRAGRVVGAQGQVPYDAAGAIISLRAVWAWAPEVELVINDRVYALRAGDESLNDRSARFLQVLASQWRALEGCPEAVWLTDAAATFGCAVDVVDIVAPCTPIQVRAACTHPTAIAVVGRLERAWSPRPDDHASARYWRRVASVPPAEQAAAALERGEAACVAEGRSVLTGGKLDGSDRGPALETDRHDDVQIARELCDAIGVSGNGVVRDLALAVALVVRPRLAAARAVAIADQAVLDAVAQWIDGGVTSTAATKARCAAVLGAHQMRIAALAAAGTTDPALPLASPAAADTTASASCASDDKPP